LDGPPVVEEPEGVLARMRAVFEANLEQVVQSPAYQRAGRESQVVHHLTAVQVGPDGSEFLYLSKLRYACLELIHAL
jgi:hypothetical protein